MIAPIPSVGQAPGAKAMLAYIQQWETAYPVASWRVGGIQIWPLLRVRLCQTMFQTWHGSKTETGDPRIRALARWMGLPLQWARGLVSWRGGNTDPFSVDASTDLLICSDFAAAAIVQGQWIDVVAEPLARLAERQGFRSRCWMLTHTHRRPAFRSAEHIQTTLDFVGLAGSVCSSLMPEPGELEGYEALLGELSKLGLPIQGLNQKYLNVLVGRLKSVSNYFRRALARVRPRMVAINCYYSLEGMALIHACRQLGIPTLDVQHGVQGDNHASYGSWAVMPRGGWELLPDHFWCWSESECRAIEAWRGIGPGPHQPHPGGNLWLDMWRNPEDPMVLPILHEVARLRTGSGSRLHGVVTLQWGIADEEFLDPLIDCLRALPRTWMWWIRLHPLQSHHAVKYNELFQQAGITNVNIADATRLPLHALLLGATVHITYSSSTVLEAAELGIPSLIMSKMGLDLFGESIEKGEAIGCNLTHSSILEGLDWAFRYKPLAIKSIKQDSFDLFTALLGPARATRRP